MGTVQDGKGEPMSGLIRLKDVLAIIDQRTVKGKLQVAREVEALPSVQPDLSSYSDKLWRSAYERGKAEAQAEIIRCRDCKHWREGTAYSYCDKLHGMGVLDIYDYMTSEDDFCSMAERR